MDFKRLEKAVAIYAKIKELDTQIIEIDKIALLAANGNTICSFDLKVENVTLKENEETGNKSAFSIDRYLSFFTDEDSFMPKWYQPTPTPKKQEANVLRNELSETATMQILGVLLLEKQSLRQKLINKLQSLGVATH